MAATVNLPILGQTRTRYVYIGGAALAVVVAWAWIAHARRKSSGEIAFDPTTGSVTGSGLYQNPVPDGPESSQPVESVPVIDTNAEWGTAAVEALSAAGWDRQFAAIAIGKYLSESPLTTEEANAVRAAWGMLGKPPVNPPVIHMATSTSTPGGSSTAPKPGAADRRYMIRPDKSRVWIDPAVPGLYSGRTESLPYIKSEDAPRRYRLLNGDPGRRVWLDLPGVGGRYNGKTQRVP